MVRWDGEVFIPLRDFQKICDEIFVVGERYRMVEARDRSMRSHNFYFAQIAETWKQLPDRYVARLPDREALRKYALMKTGYVNIDSTTYDTEDDAKRIGAMVRRINDEFCIVKVEGCEVAIFTAKSQSKKAMGAEEFEKSKNDVLDFIAQMIGVKRHETAATVGNTA